MLMDMVEGYHKRDVLMFRDLAFALVLVPGFACLTHVASVYPAHPILPD